MATPFIVGLTIAGTAYAGRFLMRAIQRAKNAHFDSRVYSIDNMAEGFKENMTQDEAESILGINSSATKEQIKIRHKLLIIKNHPDKGGSSYLATKINEAKNLLQTANSTPDEEK